MDVQIVDERAYERGLRVYEDGRTWDAIPLMPWYCADRSFGLGRSFEPTIGAALAASGRFDALTGVGDAPAGRQAAPRVLQVRLRYSEDASYHTTYLLGLHGFVLYVVGAPRGWTRTTVEVELALGPPGGPPAQVSRGSASRTTWWWIYEGHDRRPGASERLSATVGAAIADALGGLE